MEIPCAAISKRKLESNREKRQRTWIQGCEDDPQATISLGELVTNDYIGLSKDQINDLS